MEKSYKVTYVTLLVALIIGSSSAADQEEEARKYLEYANNLYAKRNYEYQQSEWEYTSNIKNETLAKKLAVSGEFAKFAKAQWLETVRFPWKTFKDQNIVRQFKKLSVLGTAALPEDKYEKYEKSVAEMESIYSKATICAYNNTEKCDLSLEPEMTEILANSRNEAELKHVWTQWRKQTGPSIRPIYSEYVKLLNEAARLNKQNTVTIFIPPEGTAGGRLADLDNIEHGTHRDFTDAGDYWLNSYDSPDFKDQIAELWKQLRPFYLEVHAYMRRKLREKYGESVVTKRGPIPAHLLGNMWAQTWSNVAELATPYPDVQREDVTKHLVEQKYTPLKMFKTAEEFFTSINLSPMTEAFWKYSVIEKPKDRDIVCHASAWDFYNGADFRIKQCTEITEEDFVTVHHEMGHIEYYMQYKNQPFVFREGANPGFHEAIGDVIALSVITPKHLSRINLLPNATYSKEADLNYLMKVALDKIVFLPFGYLMDLWRWQVFKGTISEKDYNCEWWKLRLNYQGVKPPTVRSEKDFDPASKYHIVSSTPYIRYFVSFILQFQFHEALCTRAGEFDPNYPSEKPLHQCDIYQSKEAGNLLKSVLELGSSKPWPDALEVITGQRNMDAGPLLRYFAPIYDWLKEENKKSGEYVGWDTTEKVCNSNKFSVGNFLSDIVKNVGTIFSSPTPKPQK